MAFEIKDILSFVVALLLGGSGYAAIYAFVVRPRVYFDTRDQRTVKTFSEKHRQQVEEALKNQGVPTAFFEVSWWNRGLRAANEITIEVQTPGRIRTWELSPDKSDLATTW